jgi:hypothetical protein
MSGPTIHVAPEILEASLRGARHGQGFIYAAGPALDPAHPTTLLARAWHARGEALLNIVGGRDPMGRLQYRITRVCPALRDGSSAGSAPPQDERGHDFGPARGGLGDALRQAQGDRVLQELFELLAERDAARLPCPSDAALAAMLRLQDRHAAAYRLRRLAKLGVIAISNPEPRKRVVTILSRRPAAEAAQDDRKGK